MPPQPTPVADATRTWNINFYKGVCHASHETHCPQGAMCNPPPPVEYVCPPGMGEKASHGRVVQVAGSSECNLIGEAPACPKGARCAPAHETKVPCPSR